MLVRASGVYVVRQFLVEPCEPLTLGRVPRRVTCRISPERFALFPVPTPLLVMAAESFKPLSFGIVRGLFAYGVAPPQVTLFRV
jgi:hypothetical protein